MPDHAAALRDLSRSRRQPGFTVDEKFHAILMPFIFMHCQVDVQSTCLVTLHRKIYHASPSTTPAVAVSPVPDREFSRMSKGPGQSTIAALSQPGKEELLVRDNIDWMLALAERLLRDRDLAEDCVQDAFLSAFRGMPAFEGRSSLKTWLHRITVNTCLSKLRRIKRLAEQPIDDLLPEFDNYECRIEAPWTRLTSVHEVQENEELRERVITSIGKLPDAYRIVLQLRDIEGYDTTEVAELLEISESNVKVRLHRARAALKKLLEPILRGEVDS